MRDGMRITLTYDRKTGAFMDAWCVPVEHRPRGSISGFRNVELVPNCTLHLDQDGRPLSVIVAGPFDVAAAREKAAPYIASGLDDLDEVFRFWEWRGQTRCNVAFPFMASPDDVARSYTQSQYATPLAVDDG